MSEACRRDQGFAVIVAMMGLLLMSALGAALVLATSVETLIARNFREGAGAMYAAEAAAVHAVGELSATADWTEILAGRTRSALFDGVGAGTRTLDDGSVIDLSAILNLANCGQIAACSDRAMATISTPRPWGLNNPRWRIFACGKLADLLGVPSRFYVVTLVADDPAETDNDPRADGSGPGNPGSGVLLLRAEAFAPGGVHGIVDLTLARRQPFELHRGAVRVVSWRAGR